MNNTTADKGVIFDLDGVLIDTGRYHRQSWYDLARREGFSMTEEFFNQTFGMQNYLILPKLVPGITAEEIRRMSLWKEKRFRELIKGQLPVLPGVPQLLSELRQEGFRLAIGSSTPRANLEFLLAQTGKLAGFDALVSGEDVEHSKPAPDTFTLAARKLGLPNQRCVVVEDAVQGVQAGKAAGMATVAITTTRSREELSHAGADLVVDSMAELNSPIMRDLLDRHQRRLIL